MPTNTNPNFNPQFSTNDIWRDTDDERCLTDDLNAMDNAIEALENGKSPTNHTHTEYASSTHSHTGFATKNHSHNTEYIAKALQFVSDSGDVMENLGNNDVLATIALKSAGIYTFYAPMSATNLPRSDTSWRFFAHKTAVTYCWLLAFGSDGSVYNNYLHNNVWTGWKSIYNASPSPLWSGALGMSADHTVTPSKPLSQCRNGWLLLWSDNNPNEGAQNVDFATTVVPNRSYNGSLWTNNKFLTVVPSFSDSNSEIIIIKTLHISDTQIKGNAVNVVSPRDDAVLRAVYEF